MTAHDRNLEFMAPPDSPVPAATLQLARRHISREDASTTAPLLHARLPRADRSVQDRGTRHVATSPATTAVQLITTRCQLGVAAAKTGDAHHRGTSPRAIPKNRHRPT